MILSDIKIYVREQKRATLDDIAAHFDMPTEAVRPMLDHWLKRGDIVRQESVPVCYDDCCGKCGGCSHQPQEYFVWLAK